MCENETDSSNKGIFVYMNGFSTLPLLRDLNRSKNSSYLSSLYHKAYSKHWSVMIDRLEFLRHEMYTETYGDLLNYIKKKRNFRSEETIPCAVLLMNNINKTDNEMHISFIFKQIKSNITRHIAILDENCLSMEWLIENLIWQFVNCEDSPQSYKDAKKNGQLNFPLLECWYKNVQDKTPLVVIVPECINFRPRILQKFIKITSCYTKKLPFVFIFEIPTLRDALYSILPNNVLLKLRLKEFVSPAPMIYLKKFSEDLILNETCPFLLGQRVFNFLQNTFLHYDHSVNNFIDNLKFVVFHHFLYGNLMALCDLNETETHSVIESFSMEDLESFRHLASFTKFLESLKKNQEKTELLINDEYLKAVIKIKIVEIQNYIKHLRLFLKCLFVIIEELPDSVTLQEIYCVTMEKDFKKTSVFDYYFIIFNYLSKQELHSILVNLVKYLGQQPQETSEEIKTFYEKLKDFTIELGNFIEQTNLKSKESKNFRVQNSSMTDRKICLKRNRKTRDKFEEIKKRIVEYLKQMFGKFMISPKSFCFYEIFLFDDISVKKHLLGDQSEAILTALNNPNSYLRWNCCKISEGTASTMPNICVACQLQT